MAKKYRRNKLERKLDEYNHTMELIRTIVPIAVLVLQAIILIKILTLEITFVTKVLIINFMLI